LFGLGSRAGRASTTILPEIAFMHKKRGIKHLPAMALDTYLLEFILLILRVIQEIEETFGLNFSGSEEK
jgi:hypothetical protein